MMRSGVLSEDQVIDTVNEFFVPFAINVTKDGFPKSQIPALAYIEAVYQRNWRFSFGFAGACVIDNEGQFPLGHSAASPAKKTINVHDYFGSKPFLLFLVESLERHKQVTAMRAKFRQGNFMGGFAELQSLLESIKQSVQGQVMQLLEFQARLNNSGLEKLI